MNRSFTRLATAAATALVVPLALAGCSQEDSSSKGITVGIYPNLINNFDFHIADAKGFFDDEDLEVDSVTINTGPDMVSALLSGSIDIGDQSTPTVLPVLAKQGQDIDLLYGGLELSFLMISGPKVKTSEPSSNLDAVRDLKGKKIGVTAAGALTDWFARALLKDAGLDPDKDVTIVTTGGTGSLVPALQGGKVDAAIIWNTDRSRVGQEGTDYHVVASILDGTAGDSFDGIIQEYYAAKGSVIEKKSDAIKSYCTAIDKAWEWVQDPANEDEVVSSLAEWVKISEDAAAVLWSQEKGRFIRHLDESRWDRQEALLPEGNLPSFDEAVNSTCSDMFQAG